MTYTREQILAMEPGKELSELVIREVFGYEVVPKGTTYWNKKEAPFPFVMWDEQERWCLYENDEVDARAYRWFNPSEDIDAAWELIEKFPVVNISRVEIYEGNHHFEVEIYPVANGEEPVRVEAKTAQEAICKCALLAVLDL